MNSGELSVVLHINAISGKSESKIDSVVMSFVIQLSVDYLSLTYLYRLILFQFL